MNKSLFIVLLFIIVHSCKPLYKVTEKENTAALENVIEKKLESKKADYYLCENIDIQLKGDRTINAKGKVYIERGKKIFASVGIFGIEVGRVQIAPDSIKFINRLKREYFFGEMKDIYKLSGLNLTYDELENLFLIGLPVNNSFNKRNFLSSLNMMDGEYVYEQKYDYQRNIYIFYEKNTVKEKRIEMIDKRSGFFLEALLDDYNNESDFPGSIEVSVIRNEDKKNLLLRIGKIENRYFPNTSFKINDSYAELEF